MSKPGKHPFFESKPAPKYSTYGRFTLYRAKRNGMSFLKSEKTSLWDINGFLLQTKKRRYSVVFKRRGRTATLKIRHPLT